MSWNVNLLLGACLHVQDMKIWSRNLKSCCQRQEIYLRNWCAETYFFNCKSGRTNSQMTISNECFFAGEDGSGGKWGEGGGGERESRTEGK